MRSTEWTLFRGERPMLEQVKPGGIAWQMKWRYSQLKEFSFYFRKCSNWYDVIKSRRTSSHLSDFVLRSGQVISFEGAPPFNMFREIWDRQVYLSVGTKMRALR